MHRNADSSCLIGNRASNRLTNPPRSIRTEFKTLFVVKFLNRFNQSHISFLNEIKKQHTAAYISFGNADHKAQVCFSKPTLSLFITILDTLG
ncbi:hypothetical protein D1872_249000 [compost metagenome]